MVRYYVLLGPPGAGKGTQAKVVAEKYGLVHISSGDLFRDHLKRQTDLGKLAHTFMTKGELVPDDVTIAMIRERLSRTDCKEGALLDGFPRTPVQAEALAKMLAEFQGKVSLVPLIHVPESLLIERLCGRWTCRTNGHIFHEKYNPPQMPGICDLDGSELFQRDDDRAETVVKRIQVYGEQTSPLIEYYRQNHLLAEIDGTKTIEEVSSDLLSALEKA
ncbi:MAG: adenylate kinase [Chloroflexi bacterium]|nr:adenylate kinase [Chloroflexota bacterium]